MKKYGPSLILTLFSLWLLTGCAALDRTLYEERVTELPPVVLETNTVYHTNVVVLREASTNEAGRVTAPVLEKVVTPEVTLRYAPPVLQTNLVPRPEVQMGIQAGGALPVPFAGTAALALGWAYSAYASLRNKKVSQALVQSVQAGREFLQSTPEGKRLDAEFKRRIADEQAYAGVVAEVRKLLNQLKI